MTDGLVHLFRRHNAAGPEAPEPVWIVRAEGAEVTDTAGKRYLDLASGWTAPLGHNHPAVVEALARAGQRVGVEGCEWPESIELAAKLAEVVPGGTNRRVLVLGSGREALARAIALAQETTGRQRVIYLSAIGELRLGQDTACIVAHPLDERLAAARTACDNAGVLLIDDETGIGPGLCGGLTAIERSGVRPDVYALGSGWAGGVSFGACVTASSKLCWKSAGTGNPAGCVCALAVIRELEGGLVEQGRQRAEELALELGVLGKYPVVTAGQGLVWSVWFRGAEKESAIRGQKAESRMAERVRAKCREQGLLLARVGEEAVGIRPSLVVTKGQVVAAVRVLEESVRLVCGQK